MTEMTPERGQTPLFPGLLCKLLSRPVNAIDVYKPWFPDAMYWPMSGFEDTFVGHIGTFFYCIKICTFLLLQGSPVKYQLVSECLPCQDKGEMKR